MATMSARYTVIDGEVVAQERGGVRHQLVPDALGSTVALYDNAGTKTDTFSYWPYGENSSRTGSTNVKFQYVGVFGYYRSSASKDYIRARYLDNSKGVWITQDPMRFNNGDYNLYEYGKSSPVVYIDPSGNVATAWIIIGGILIIGGLIIAPLIKCKNEAEKIHDILEKWPHNHSGTPKGGDKLVHCIGHCVLRVKYGSQCAWLVARKTERCHPFAFSIGCGGTSEDEDANGTGVRIGEGILMQGGAPRSNTDTCGGPLDGLPDDDVYQECGKRCMSLGGYGRWR